MNTRIDTRMAENAAEFDSDFMPPEELFARLGIGRTQGYAMARRDELPVPTLRVGRQFRFSRRAYEALATAQHDPAGTDAVEVA